MANFYSRLSYSFGNEDWTTEHRALQIKPDDTILCVTASGDRPLNLMTANFKEMVAVDANPLQNALFDLKRVALSKLSFPNYMAFMGARQSKQRQKIYEELQDDLDPMAHALLERQIKKIEQGILYQGSVEKILKYLSTTMKIFRGKKIEKLFSFDNIEQQREFVKNHWQTPVWKKTLYFALHPFVTRTFMKDPGLYEHVDSTFHVGKQIDRRLTHYLNKNLAKESTLLSLLLQGSVAHAYFPPYLTESGVAKIKQQVHKARFHTANLVSFLENSNEERFDCFSVSDIASYMDRKQFNRLVEGIFKTAKPNARFCIRQFMTNHQIPPHLAHYFKRDERLDEQLREDDRCFVYSFMTGTIQKP